MSNANAQARDLTIKSEFKLVKFLIRWEMFLVYLLLLTNIILLTIKPNLYFESGTISSIIQSGMDLSFMVLGMVFVLMIGEIDVSVASIMITSGMVIGLLMNAGVNQFIAVACGIAAGAACGFINGILVAKAKMPSVIVTIASALLFRGIVKIILDVNVLKNYPKWFVDLSWDNVLGIPISLICFLVASVVFAIVLHKSKFGRHLYMIGNSNTVAQYSGVRVARTKILVFVIMGIMAGIASIFFVGRMGGGLSSTMAKGYELDVIAIAVLGGISTNGGKGKIYGPVIATLIMAFLFYTMGLLNVDTNVRKILTGIILIIAVLIPNLNKKLLDDIKLKLLYRSNKNIEAINHRCAEDVSALNRKIIEIKRDKSLAKEEKALKIQALEEKIASLRKKCKQTTKSLIEEEKKAIRAIK